MKPGTIPQTFSGKIWSFIRSGDSRGLYHSAKRRWALVKRALTGPVGPGALVVDPQTELAAGQTPYIEECISPHSVSPTLLAVHLAPYRYALPFMVDKEVLEVGCNWGYGSHLFAHAARRIVGLDVNREFVNYGNSRFAQNNLDLMVHDVNEPLPFSDESFDVVFSSEVIEHIANYLGCLREMQRVLRSDGVLILKTPNLAYAPRWHALNPYHLKVFRPSELEELLKAHFDDVQLQGFCERYEHSVTRIENSFDPFAIPFGQRIPYPFTIEVKAWVEPKLVEIDEGVPSNLLAVCRGPKRNAREYSKLELSKSA
jgi:2-polyprenyl-3-methyl-5-hydroxy-6-metoxy-1,4-benzoquinol methylase